MQLLKSITFNAAILYILFKSSLSELILAKLPKYIRHIKSSRQLAEQVIDFLWRGSLVSRRMFVIIAIVSALFWMKKIWARFQGQALMNTFVKKYLCDVDAITLQCQQPMAWGGRGRLARLPFGRQAVSVRGERRIPSNRQDQQLVNAHRFNSQKSMPAVYSQPQKPTPLVSLFKLQKKQRNLRQTQSQAQIQSQSLLEAHQLHRLSIVMETIIEEDAIMGATTSPLGPHMKYLQSRESVEELLLLEQTPQTRSDDQTGPSCFCEQQGYQDDTEVDSSITSVSSQEEEESPKLPEAKTATNVELHQIDHIDQMFDLCLI